ncbi:MAG: glycosyltransferase family 39 protein, partial [Chloroflexi bacterium]|nr:glycosyltransferase family 39 protein [Chloroflexota bacterium]
VQSIARGNGLPIQDPAIKTLWAQEGGQPPLYYALSALATFWIDTRDLEERRWINPHAQIGIPLLFGNKNLVVHTSAENFPWQGTTLAVHLIRFLSIIFSAFTVLFTYLLALEIGNGFVIASETKQSSSFKGIASLPSVARNDVETKTLAATAAAFVAFNPMFVFISASVNNDSLATMLATLALLALTRLITRPVSRARFIFLGVALGLAVLTKVSNLGLLIVAGIVFTMSLREAFVAVASDLCVAKQSPKSNSEIASPPMAARNDAIHGITASPRLLVSAFVAAALVIVIAFWWYARNWILYGDPLAFNVWLAIAGARPQPFALTDLLKEFQGLRISFWGNFGGVAHTRVTRAADVSRDCGDSSAVRVWSRTGTEFHGFKNIFLHNSSSIVHCPSSVVLSLSSTVHCHSAFVICHFFFPLSLHRARAVHPHRSGVRAAQTFVGGHERTESSPYRFRRPSRTRGL